MNHGAALCVFVAVFSIGCSGPAGGTNGSWTDGTGGSASSGGGGGSGGASSGGSGGIAAGKGDASAVGSVDGASGGSSGASGSGSGGRAEAGLGGSSGSSSTDASGSSGSGSGANPPTTGSCPSAPGGAPSNAVQAWTVLNQTRQAAGAGCMNLVTTLDTSAQAHCNYEAANSTNATCISNPHGEVMSCSGFTGVDVQTREVAAGYPKTLAYTEVMTTFGNNPTAAVPSWIDTVFHRIPMLDPWTVDMGYGGAAGCDTIDIGRGMSSMAATGVVVYPYDGQTNVPSAFSGSEGPAPPAPPSGWPSSYPINIYAQGLTVTQHVLTKDGDSTPIDHLWLDANSSQISAGLKGYFVDTAFLYGAPFALSTKYRVKIVGTHTGGALNVEWTFTTGSQRPFGT
jgi:uncharacterized protein YkwD